MKGLNIYTKSSVIVGSLKQAKNTELGCSYCLMGICIKVNG